MSDTRRLPVNVPRCGSETALPAAIGLRAGLVSADWENGDLRDIRIGDREILRRSGVVFRDPNWDTLQPQLTSLHVERGEDFFRVEYDCAQRHGSIDFTWHARIVGSSDGTITFGMEGAAQSTFIASRIGFVVLHPIRECAGQPFRATFVDGRVETGRFPSLISPNEPARNLRAIAHEIQPALWAEVQFQGEEFEMEDQRNWTDASFKTYSAPPNLPYPFEVRAGTAFMQSVKMRLEGTPLATAKSRTDLRVTVGRHPVARLPRLGLGSASHGRPLSASELARLRALSLGHVRIDLNLEAEDLSARQEQATRQALALGVRLEAALRVSGEENALRGLASELHRLQPPIDTWLVFQGEDKSTTDRWVRAARQHLMPELPNARFGAGSNANFVELNRKRPLLDAIDVVCYAITPQVHAFDNRSLVETLEGQAETVRSAHALAGARLIAVSPVTLRPRSSRKPTVTGSRDGLPDSVDTRQPSLFAAGWTVGSLTQLAQGDVFSITYYETTGWRGVMDTDGGSERPDLFRSMGNCVFPVYHVLADACEFAGADVLSAASNQPLNVQALAMARNGHSRVLLANLGPEPAGVRLAGLEGPTTLRVLDEEVGQHTAA